MTQKFAFGYMTLDDGISNEEIAALRQQMSECAISHGLVLDRIFSSQVNSTGSAFAELIDALCSGDVHVVVIPSLRHFAHLKSVSEAINEYLKQQTGAQVLVADPESAEPVVPRLSGGSGQQ